MKKSIFRKMQEEKESVAENNTEYEKNVETEDKIVRRKRVKSND